ncbi:discoidin domain-containing protein [Nocardioides sp.]|uniref:discoidin domain-containing protein n=1 Tax=Nocardioides sp. TaxID=35761 RepID=UPI003D0E708B
MSRPTRRPGALGSSPSVSSSPRVARAFSLTGAALALGALTVLSLPDPARAAEGSPLRVVEENVSYTVPGASLSFAAPSWATHATITIAGAAGASTCAAGGRGTEVTATTEVQGGETFSISLGENGKHARGNARAGSGVTSVPDNDETSEADGEISANGKDAVAPGGWGPANMHGGSATWRDQAGTPSYAVVAGGGGGSELRLDGKTAVLAGGGGGAGLCADGAGGAGGSTWTGFDGSRVGILDGGKGGGFATSTHRAGDPAVNAGGGGGGSNGGGYGSSGQSSPLNEYAGAGGGGAGGSWVAPELRWDTTTSADASKTGSYATIVFANRDLHATGNLATDRPVNASSSLEHDSFSSTLLTDGFTKSMTGHNAFSTTDPRPTPGNGATVQEWVEIDLGQTQSISSLRLYPRTTAPDDTTDVTGAGFPEAFTIDVSTDGKTWKRVGSYAGQTGVTQARTYAVTPTDARWVRLNATTLGPVAAGDHGHRLQLAELEIYR